MPVTYLPENISQQPEGNDGDRNGADSAKSLPQELPPEETEVQVQMKQVQKAIHGLFTLNELHEEQIIKNQNQQDHLEKELTSLQEKLLPFRSSENSSIQIHKIVEERGVRCCGRFLIPTRSPKHPEYYFCTNCKDIIYSDEINKQRLNSDKFDYLVELTRKLEELTRNQQIEIQTLKQALTDEITRKLGSEEKQAIELQALRKELRKIADNSQVNDLATQVAELTERVDDLETQLKREIGAREDWQYAQEYKGEEDSYSDY